jgi:hypothetical protein
VGADVWGAFYPLHPALIPTYREASKFKLTSASTDDFDNYGSVDDKRNG